MGVPKFNRTGEPYDKGTIRKPENRKKSEKRPDCAETGIETGGSQGRIAEAA